MLEARDLLLDVRTELHRLAGRARDVLRAQDADEVAAVLELGDRFDLARALSGAARAIAFAAEVGLRSAAAALPRRGLAALRRPPVRRPLAAGSSSTPGRWRWPATPRPPATRRWCCGWPRPRPRTGLPVAAGTLHRLADTAPELREPWPRPALDELLSLLGTGRPLVDVVESLDRTGLWGRLFPEWGAVRDLPPRDRAHVWTVDRHLVEAAAHAGRLTTRVARPDLLLVGALLHDIGKGRGGDHSVVGESLAQQIARGWASPSPTSRSSGRWSRHHLLLPHTATRRDLDDPATVTRVDPRRDGAPRSTAAGCCSTCSRRSPRPTRWPPGRACGARGSGADRRPGAALPGRCWPGSRCRSRAAAAVAPSSLAAVAADGGPQVRLGRARPGHGRGRGRRTARASLSPRPGCSPCTRWRCTRPSWRAAEATASGRRCFEFTVSPRFGGLPDPALLRADLVRVLDGTLALGEALARKERDYAPMAPTSEAPPPARVLWFDDEATGAVVLELRATDRIGLLHRVAAALEGARARPLGAGGHARVVGGRLVRPAVPPRRGRRAGAPARDRVAVLAAVR